MACRPSVARLLPSLPVVLATLGVLSALGAGTGCGKGTPKYERKTADEWVERLWSGDSETVMRASESIVAFADTHPDAVIAALEKQLLRTPPTPGGVAFVIALDTAEAKRLGLAHRLPQDVLAMQLGHLRRRIAQGGDMPASIRGTSDGHVELILDGERTREQAERVQRRLVLRGALDLRLIAEDLAGKQVRPAAAVYDGTVPYDTLLEREAERFLAAAKAGTPYTPEDARWRVAPRESARTGPEAKPLAPSDFLLLREPATGAPVVDEGWFSAVTPEDAPDGSKGLRLTVRVEKAQAFAAFVRESAGGRWAVVVDERVRGIAPVPPAAGPTLWLPIDLSPVAPDAHAQALADLAIALSSGRLPWPMKSEPLAKEYGRDPPPGNPIAKTIAVIGSPALPTLRRVRDGNGPAWGKASAAWAIEQIELIEGTEPQPPK